MYHTFVLAGYKNIRLEEIEDELARRHGISGIEEKNRRKKDESVG
jgi:phosphoribosyl-ATP pyrophosphohydrolase